MVLTKVGNENGLVHIEYYETRLHREGVIELKLANPADAEKFHEGDTAEIPGVCDCIPGEEITIVLHHSDDSVDEVHANCA